MSPQTTTAREYVDSRPSLRIVQVEPRSTLVASPPAQAASTSVLVVATWWTSASMSIVGFQVRPWSPVWRIPPTCTFT